MKALPVPITVQVAAGNLASAREFAEKVVSRVRDVPGTVDVQIGQALDYPQLDVEVDRTRASYMGLSQKNVAENILTALGSSVGYAPSIWVDPTTGIDFFLGVQYKTNEVESLDAMRNLPLAVRTPDGPKNIPLSNLAKIRRVNIPGEIAHYNISRVYDVLVNVENRDVGSVAADVEKAVGTLDPPDGVNTTLRGPVVTMKKGTACHWMGARCCNTARLSCHARPVSIVRRSAHYYAGSSAGVSRCCWLAVPHRHYAEYSITSWHIDDDWHSRKQ